MTLQDDIKEYASGWNVGIPDVLVKQIAEGLEQSRFMVKLADLPEVTEEPDEVLHAGGSRHGTTYTTSDGLHKKALNYIALALHLQSRESEAAALQARRDELARELSSLDLDYRRISKTARVAIDRLIAAEAEVARLRGERS